MPELLEFLRTHEEAFRSRARLASLYSDFRHQRNTNPEGYQANSSAWLRALSVAAKAGLLPSQTGTPDNDRFSVRTGEELSRALQTQEFGRPLALGSVVQDAVRDKQLVPLKDFLDSKKSIYAKSWVPTPWQVVSWGLRQLGVMGGDSAEDRLVAGNFVIMANVEAAAKEVMSQASTTATSNISRVFSHDLFVSTFSSTVGAEALSRTDMSVLLTYLSRDRSALAYSPTTGTIKFKAASEAEPSSISDEDVNIASLRTLISSIEPQIQHLTDRMAELDNAAREAVTKKQPALAKSALRSKKLADTKLQQRITTLAQLEDVYSKIEQAADQVEIVRVMEASSQTLKSLNRQTGGVEKVQDVMEGLREEMMNADEIGQAINEVSAGQVDEREVDDELEEMERVEREQREKQEREARESKEEVERKEMEAREEAGAEETRRKLAELDKIGEKEEPAVQANEPEKARETEQSAV